MSTATADAPPGAVPAPVDAGAVLRLSLVTTEAPDVLVRVLCLLRRRGCTLLSVDFAHGDRHRPGRLDIALRTESRVSHRLGEWLLGLVDVLAVEDGW